MSRGTRSLYTIIDDWAGEKAVINNENWSSAIKKGEIEIGIVNDVSATRDRISDLEAQFEALKNKKKRRKLKIKVKM